MKLKKIDINNINKFDKIKIKYMAFKEFKENKILKPNENEKGVYKADKKSFKMI